MEILSTVKGIYGLILVGFLGFFVAKEYDLEFIAEQLSKTEESLGYYKEYEKKQIEQKIIDDYIYEDDDDVDDYENGNSTDFMEGIELTGTKIDHDEAWRKLDEKMKNRVKYLRRTCQMRRKIQNLIDADDFDGLLKLHEQIYDLNKALPKDDETPLQCNPPSFSKKKNQARFIKGRRQSHTDIFHEPNLNLTICLPPKCGTTNWQNALASLTGKHGRAQIPRLHPDDYADNSFAKKISKLKVLNTRNPFQRLVSAWRDKFHVKHNPRRQGYFLPSIRVFEGPYEKPEQFSCSFEAFASSRAANPSEFVNNRHWRTVHWECSPCHFEYDLILHLEDVDLEYDYAWEKIADIKPVLRQQYANSPMAKHHPSWYWRNVPKDVAKKIYMIYFMDLAGLGYSPEECMRYVNSASEADVLSLENIVKARSNLNHPELYMNQSYLHEICY
ncbi:Oidioi.mRNA.OKI2018_I69.chr1.g262.t2.cds [Oikopleura dioica]|uniref:Carbohydrate sulfotransferase n=1 Tax=Oikopleura dioica TaxID=34765 RepID=A0ABN7SNI4_OIKDI|nr:Oidioi.mRNA.OKI2018_I69.chr1.g262.t2.cds [Oikopleura dioica]